MKDSKTPKSKNNTYISKHFRNIQLMFVSCVTGFFAGLIVSCYTLAAGYAEELSKDIYAFLRQNPAFLPLMLAGLVASALVISVGVKLLPMIRGSGIPQTEGAARGLLKFGWWQTMTGMAAYSLFSILTGMTAGAEGPSILIGGTTGMGVANLSRRSEIQRRYQITGGACAGLAVAFNAPLTGMAFAFEEAHKRFTPEIVICSSSSVIMSLITRNLIFGLMGRAESSAFTTFVLKPLPLSEYGYALLVAVVAALAGILFYFAVLLSGKLFGKFTSQTGFVRFLIPLLVGGVFALITVNVMGGGHDLIQGIGTYGGTREMNVESIFSSPIVITLLIVVVLKFLSCIINMGAGLPAGMFIPMLAVGASIGALMSKVCMLMGMSAEFSDLMVMLSMTTFFTAIVKAPFTAMIMAVELTWSFAPLLPIVLGICIAYMVSVVFNIEPIYEKLLDGILERMGKGKNLTRYKIEMQILSGCLADGYSIRDILWPTNSVISLIRRGEEEIVPDGETRLLAGDHVVIRFESDDYDGSLVNFNAICGKQKEVSVS